MEQRSVFVNYLKTSVSLIFAVWLALCFPIALPAGAQEQTTPSGEAVRREEAPVRESVALFLSGGAVAARKKQDEKEPEKMLVPGGTPFGVRFYTDGVLIARVDEGGPAASAGLAVGDIIRRFGEEKIESLPQLLRALEKCGAGETAVCYDRCGKPGQTVLKLTAQDGKTGEDLIGAGLRDSMAGIGTLTFYDPESGIFAGLGHGICLDNGGVLLPFGHGSIANVRITSVLKGKRGSPGQLRGIFYPGQTGELLKNTGQGVYGVFRGEAPQGTPLPTASREDVRTGRAEILCTLQDGVCEKYEIEIEKILPGGEDGKNYLLHVTDARLLEIAGGIVQGMSGSPILQDGRIVGAVTHVLVEDPTRGYGIYIGKMLANAA